uniref:Uncharacterized protein n=2 Tax=Leersia perrieri TaxID=77586 RepID=A0A0D9XGP4_9ORYZ
MSGGHRKTPVAAPDVATTGCSALISCLSLHRRATPSPPPSTRANVVGGAPPMRPAAEEYWRRVQQLEEEVRRLGKRINAAAAAAAGDHVTTAENKCSSVGVEEMVKLHDGGGYLHEIKQVVGMPWTRLALQVSQPAVAENAATASEVLDKMTETSADDLCKFLSKMMPIKDIAGRKNHHHHPNAGNVIRKSARLNSGDDFIKALLFKAMDHKMGILIQQGLKIQMASMSDSNSSMVAGSGEEKRQPATSPASRKDCMVYVVLIQVRDPDQGYASIGDPMIGLMEAVMEKKDGKVKLEMQGMHVAGIIFGGSRKTASNVCRGMIWSTAFCHCSYARNPNRVFKRFAISFVICTSV